MQLREHAAALAYVSVVVGSGALAVGLVRLEYGKVGVVLGLTTLIAFGLVATQLLWSPVRAKVRAGLRQTAAVDVAHMVLSNGLTNALFKVAAFGLLVTVAEHHTGLWWPDALPLPLKVALGLVAGELFFYSAHRLAHEHPLVWRVHAVHHSSTVLNVLSAGRNHPLNSLVSYACQTVPAVLLGADGETIVALSMFTTINGMLQHTDLGLRFGWLDHILATSTIHHWHHSAVPAEGNANYGSNLVIFDKLLGTFLLPPDRERPERMGLDDLDLPDNWWSHLALPFAWRRFQRAAG